jgi:zinc transport system substrate-binding protein
MRDPFTRLAAAAALAMSLCVTPAMAEIRAAATIKPIHSLLAAVMAGTREPELLLDGPASPHLAALRPSQARIVEGSDVVFAVGEGLEGFLHSLLESGDTRIVELVETPAIKLLGYRETGNHSDEHDGDDEGEEHHHEHGAVDPHIWLDPDNAKAMVAYIATVLGAADPANASIYRDNARAAARGLEALKTRLADILAPVKDRPLIVFHDAYQYFEAAFGLNGLGAIVLNPETPPGPRRLQEIRRRIEDSGVACVFSEPQFEIGYVTTVLEGTGARTASLDPNGVAVEPGPHAYGQILTSIMESLADCLGG